VWPQDMEGSCGCLEHRPQTGAAKGGPPTGGLSRGLATSRRRMEVLRYRTQRLGLGQAPRSDLNKGKWGFGT
jgi:hypothetical protein